MYEANSSAEEVVNITPQKSQVVDEKPKKKFKWKKSLGYFVLGLVILGIGYLGYRFYEFKPYRVIVSNVTSRSATISWITEDPEPGKVVFKEGNIILPFRVNTYGMNIGYDDRDYSNAELEAANTTQENISESTNRINSEDIETEIVVTEFGKYWSHHVVIRNLNPETEYEFFVGDGFVFEKNSTIDTDTTKITTLKEVDNVDTPIPAYGIIRYYDGEKYTPPVDTLVYCTLYDETSQTESNTISSVISDTGGWYLDLTNVYIPNGERFLDYIEEDEETNIKLRLTIENEWLGRWSKEISINESAPANAIELYDAEDEDYINPDENLKYEGISFEEERIVSFLINNAFAKSIIDDSESSTATIKNKEETTKSITTTSTTKDTPVSKTKTTQNKKIQVSLADAARAAAYEAQAADYLKKEAENTENTEEERIEAAKKAQQARERSKKVIETIENSKDDKIEADTLTDIVKEVKKTELTDEGIIKSMKGDCSIDGICDPEEGENLQCGWYSEEKCICSCGKYAPDPSGELSEGYDYITISAGDTCSCDTSNGQPIVEDGEVGEIEEYGDDLEGGYHCILGEAQGYWVQKNDDKGIDMPLRTDITTKEECFATNKIDYYSKEDKNIKDISPDNIDTTNLSPEEMIKSLIGTNCEDSITHNLVLVGYSSDTYLDCKSNHIFEVKSYKDTTCADNSASLGGYCCNEMSKNYSQVDGEYAQCIQNQWVKVTEENIQKKVTVKYTNIGLGDDCNTALYDYCQCKYTVTDENGTTSGNYKIIKGSASTVCGLEYNGIETVGSATLKLSSIFAEEDSTTKYLVDTENSTIKGLTPGEYSYEYDGDLYMFDVTEYEYAQTGGEFSLYVDLDMDGEIDDTDVKITDSATEVELEVLEKGFTYSLTEGFNFISFPFVFNDTDITMASDLLEYLNNKYDNSFYSISKYDSGKWAIVGGNSGTYDQNDFQLIPGQGYVLKTKWDVNITLYGNEVTYEYITDSAPIGLSEGWNLVGLYGTSVKSYTAESILADITNYEAIDFTAVNVSRWVESRALYEALQRDEDSTVYGLDFPIELKKSYFIKVTNGSGNWEPGVE